MPNQYTGVQPRQPIYVIGPSIAYIPLTKGYYTLVDRHLAAYLTQWNWRERYDPLGNYYYAERYEYKGRCIQMHRDLLRLRHGDGLEGDHINRITLDNRVANLRVATRSQQCFNRGLQKSNTSGFVGVSWTGKKWYAYITHNGKRRHVGYYTTKEDAVAARLRTLTNLSTTTKALRPPPRL